jgi:ATP-dependent DNA helicase RecG
MDLLEALKRPEGKTLEFKRDLSSPDGVLRTVLAFANTAGGVLLIGVEDASRNVRGVPEPLALEERLASLISDTIEPRLVPDLEIRPWRRTHVVAVQVHPSPSRPHYLRREGLEAGVYVRVGSTNRRADRELIEELRRFARGVAFDEQAMPELDSEALDFRAASESFAPVRKLKRRDLETLRLVTTHQGRSVPTVAGVLLFGKDRARHFPDAWIQAGRFRGADKAHIADHVEIRAFPVPAIEAAVAFVQKHVLHGAEIGAVRRTERWSLPPAAVREAIVNAVTHADYAQRGAPIRVSLFDDRLEVENPGLLPFGLTIDDLHRGVSKLRNRVIGRVFHELGLVEQWGSGIPRMAAACRDAGLAPPLLEELATRFRVTLRTARAGAPAVDPTDHAILDALADGEGRSTQQIAGVIGLTPRATRTRLSRLVGRGLVREIGTSPQDPKRRYFRSEAT